MKINIISLNGCEIAEVQSDNVEINNVQDALEIFVNCLYHGASKVIMHERNINPDLFNLKAGLAGEVFQKCSNYKIQLAIIGDFSKFLSKSLQQFISESNKYGQINFVSTKNEAKERLLKNNF